MVTNDSHPLAQHVPRSSDSVTTQTRPKFLTRGRRILIALGFKIERFYFPKILTPLNLGGSKFLLGWIARIKVHSCAKFGNSSSNGVGARGQKAEMQKCALRAHFCTLGAVRPHGTQVRPRPFWPESLGSRRPPVWAVAVLVFLANFSRGGTWRVTRDTWRHVTNTIVVPDLWRIF